MRHLFVFFLLIALAVSLTAIAEGQDAQPRDKWNKPKVNHGKGSATVESDDPRPLWMALIALEAEYGWIIDYEEPIYSADESVTRPNAKWDSLHPGKPSRVPAGKAFASEYPESPGGFSDTAQRMSVLRKVVADYNQSSNPGAFEVRFASPRRIHVIGYSRKGDKTALLDREVTLAAGKIGGLDAVKNLADALSQASGVKVVLGVMPLNLLAQAQVDIKGTATPAREILVGITDATAVPLMWDLCYDFDSDQYFLNLRAQSQPTFVGASKLATPQ
jgi:hypothetical protein